MQKLICSIGLGLFMGLGAGTVAAGDPPPSGTEHGVKKAVRVPRPDPRERLAILEIVRDAGNPEHAVRAQAMLRWTRREQKSASSAPLVTGLSFRSPRSRAFSAWALGEIGASEAVRPLGRRVLFDTDSAVRRSAIDSLRKIGEGHDNLDVVGPVAAGLGSRYESVRLRAASALGDLGNRRAVRYLVETFDAVGGPGPRVNLFAGRQVSYVRGYDVEVATGASIAKPNVGIVTPGVVLDDRVTRTQSRTRIFYRIVIRSLEKLSGRRFGDDVAAWRHWYRSGMPDVAGRNRGGAGGQASDRPGG